MEFNHIEPIPMPVLRNRLILLHHFSNLFCKSLSLFSLHSKHTDSGCVGDGSSSDGFDGLRGVLVSSAKVCVCVCACVCVCVCVCVCMRVFKSQGW